MFISGDVGSGLSGRWWPAAAGRGRTWTGGTGPAARRTLSDATPSPEETNVLFKLSRKKTFKHMKAFSLPTCVYILVTHHVVPRADEEFLLLVVSGSVLLIVVPAGREQTIMHTVS